MILRQDQRGVDWVWLNERLPQIAGYIFCIALGGWLNSISNHEVALPYLKQATENYEHVEKLAGKNPVATIKCLHKKADTAEQIAQDAVDQGADVNVQDIPKCPPLPSENAKQPH